MNVAGYSLSIVDTRSMKVVSQISTGGRLFVGLQVTGAGPYTAWVSGGGDNSLKRFTISTAGAVSQGDNVAIKPITPADQGFVSNYRPDKALNTARRRRQPAARAVGLQQDGRRGHHVPGGIGAEPRRQVPLRRLQRRQQPGGHRHGHLRRRPAGAGRVLPVRRRRQRGRAVGVRLELGRHRVQVRQADLRAGRRAHRHRAGREERARRLLRAEDRHRGRSAEDLVGVGDVRAGRRRVRRPRSSGPSTWAKRSTNWSRSATPTPRRWRW